MTASDDRRTNLMWRYAQARKKHQPCAHLWQDLRRETTDQLRREIEFHFWRWLFAHCKQLFPFNRRSA